jgi:hypothetical protein
MLVLIFHLCGFSSDMLKSDELLTICNLIYNTRLKGQKKLAIPGGSTLLRQFVSTRVSWIPWYLLMYFFIIKNKNLSRYTSDVKTIKTYVFNTQTKCTCVLKYIY